MMRDAISFGQAFLGLVLFIGTIIILIGLLVTFLTNTAIDTGYGYESLVTAEAVAQSGVQDALLQLDRNSSFPGTCGCSTNGYTVTVGSSTATVFVGPLTAAGTVNITSTATVANRTRKISVLAAVNASTSQVAVISSRLAP